MEVDRPCITTKRNVLHMEQRKAFTSIYLSTTKSNQLHEITSRRHGIFVDVDTTDRHKQSLPIADSFIILLQPTYLQNENILSERYRFYKQL